MPVKSTILVVLFLGSMTLATPYGPYRERRRPGTKGGSHAAGISGGVGVGAHALSSNVGAVGSHRIPGGTGSISHEILGNAGGIGAHAVTASPAAAPIGVTITDGIIPDVGIVGTHGVLGGAGPVPHGATIASGNLPQTFPGLAGVGVGVADVHAASGGAGLTASGITGGSGHIHLPVTGVVGGQNTVGDHGAVGGPFAVGDHGAVGGPFAVGDHGAVGGPVVVGDHDVVQPSIVGSVDLSEEDFGLETSYNPAHYPDIVPGFPFQDSYPGRGFGGCANWCRSSVQKNYYCCTRTSYKG